MDIGKLPAMILLIVLCLAIRVGVEIASWHWLATFVSLLPNPF